MKAYHFVNETLRDGRPVPKDGVWLVHPEQLVMCSSGLHASVRPIDALRYAPGNTLCRVELDGNILRDTDKLVVEKRKIIWRIDAEELLKAFARWCAIQVIDKWAAPDVVIKFLRTGDENLREDARNAAGASSYDAYAAARAARAARAATYAAATYAATYAADAATAAAYAAAYAAYGAAFRKEQNAALLEFIKEARQGYVEWELTW